MTQTHEQNWRWTCLPTAPQGRWLSLCGSRIRRAIIFGGGIGENTKFVREHVCAGLFSSGLEIDAEASDRLIDIEGRLSTATSRIAAWVIPSEERMQIAHECCLA